MMLKIKMILMIAYLMIVRLADEGDSDCNGDDDGNDARNRHFLSL